MTIKKASETFGIKISTTYDISNKYRKGNQTKKRKRGSKKPRLLNQEQRLQIVEWVDEDCTITLNELAQKFQDKFQFRPSITTIFNCLKDFHYTVKRISKTVVKSYTEGML